MDIKTKTREILMGPLTTWREHIWKEHGVRDPGPSIGFLVDGAEEYDHAPNDVIHDLQEQGGDAHDIIYTVVKHRASFNDFTKYREIVAVLDAYGFEGTKEEREQITGTLEEDFQTNPHTKVTEQVAVVIAADDLVGGSEAAVGIRTYGLDDGGQLTWGEPRVWGPDDEGARIDGRIIAALKWGVEHAHEG